ncbi:hypothetical protein BU26DRAFT_305641 [Trematosphaeria pertusa]|uniref:Uncharacterized protein n=1 Tax=Trematosphaeria pertusa TaxID=390896 RepID=A0A6A6IEC1_9PLEO|nr:uncharacterized protein BU26DRAFT_305641 [Trematosphaeria pertusa]KAF2248776.1 hypothetical protein BU26DRAFT_305641 [Trematosphaeria pertusa]
MIQRSKWAATTVLQRDTAASPSQQSTTLIPLLVPRHYTRLTPPPHYHQTPNPKHQPLGNPHTKQNSPPLTEPKKIPSPKTRTSPIPTNLPRLLRIPVSPLPSCLPALTQAKSHIGEQLVLQRYMFCNAW